MAKAGRSGMRREVPRHYFVPPPPALSFKPLRLFSLVSNMGRWPLVVIGVVVGKTLGLGMVVFKLFVCNTAGGGGTVVLEHNRINHDTNDLK